MTKKERTEQRAREILHAEIRKVGDEFRETVTDIVNNMVLLGDTESMSELSHLVAMYTAYNLLRSLKRKGLNEDITALCDKAGRIEG